MGAEIGNSTQKLHARGPIGAARAHDLQVRGRRLRAGPRVAGLRVGILGGAFNPPHMGHLVCAQEALVQLELDRVVFMPVGRGAAPRDRGRPGRRGPARDGGAGGGGRRALRRRRGSSWTARGPSYTADTLEQLRERVARRRAVPDPGWRPGRGAARPGTSPRRCSSARPWRCSSASSWGRNAIGIKIGRLPGARAGALPRHAADPGVVVERSGAGCVRARRSGTWCRTGWPSYIEAHDLYAGERAEEASLVTAVERRPTPPRWPSASPRSPRTGRRSTSA